MPVFPDFFQPRHPGMLKTWLGSGQRDDKATPRVSITGVAVCYSLKRSTAFKEAQDGRWRVVRSGTAHPDITSTESGQRREGWNNSQTRTESDEFLSFRYYY
jgi:hypothetical protein